MGLAPQTQGLHVQAGRSILLIRQTERSRFLLQDASFLQEWSSLLFKREFERLQAHNHLLGL